MSANVPATLVAVADSVRRAGSAITTDEAKRLLGNLYRTFTRVTGNVPTGFSADRGGHDHSGVGSGLPMPRSLGHTIKQFYTERDTAAGTGSGYAKIAAQPIIHVCLAPFATGTHGTSWFNLLNIVGSLTIAPTFRRVKISPGINWVGAQIVGIVSAWPDATSHLSPPVEGWLHWGDVRLSSKASSLTADPVDGSTNVYTSPTYTGEPVSLHGGGSMAYVGTKTIISGPMARTWLGQPLRPKTGEPYASSLADGDAAGGLSGRLLGAVKVSPGVENDVNIEVHAGRVDAIWSIYAIRLFEIDAPTTAVFG